MNICKIMRISEDFHLLQHYVTYHNQNSHNHENGSFSNRGLTSLESATLRDMAGAGSQLVSAVL